MSLKCSNNEFLRFILDSADFHPSISFASRNFLSGNIRKINRSPTLHLISEIVLSHGHSPKQVLAEGIW